MVERRRGRARGKDGPEGAAAICPRRDAIVMDRKVMGCLEGIRNLHDRRRGRRP
jgi:hypothetical protein